MSKNIYKDLNVPEVCLFNLDIISSSNLPQRIIKSLQEVKPDNILIINEKTYYPIFPP